MGIDVYEIVKNRFNQSYTVDENTIYLVELFQSGEVYLRNECPQPILLRTSSILGTIHSCSISYINSYTVMNYEWMKQYERNAKRKMINIIANSTNGEIIKDLKYRMQLNEEISDWVKLFDSVTFGMSHGDYYCEQYCVNKDKITIFDFTNCAKVPLCWEIFNSYVESAKECKKGKDINLNNLDAYYQKYIEKNSRLKSDLSVAHKIYLYWCVMDTKGYCDDSQSQGRYDVERGQKNTRICRFIYENLEAFDKYFLKYNKF